TRDLYGADLRWVVGDWMEDIRTPEEVVVIERREWGNFYVYLNDVRQNGEVIATGADAWPALQQAVDRALAIYDDIQQLEKSDIGRINAGLERVRLRERGYELNNELTPDRQAALDAERTAENNESAAPEGNLTARYHESSRESLTLPTPD